MNQQQAFDIVLTKLRAQGVASIRDDGRGCLYRSQYGCCAVGHLLPEGLPLSRVDNDMVVSDLLDQFNIPELDNLSLAFLDELQIAHDCLMPLAPGAHEADRLETFRLKSFDGIERSMAAWEGRMAGIASYYGLTYDKPN